MKKNALRGLVAALLVATPLAASAAVSVPNIQITEWMYSGNGGEFIELTNLGDNAVDFSGWSYDDDSRLPGVFSLSAFGVVGTGQSVILTESSMADFMAAWNLSASVKVIGGYTNNLGRNDEINIFDASGTLVDRLTYGDQSFAGTVRTQSFSGTPTTLSVLDSQTVTTGWIRAATGDVYGSYASSFGDVGNPGVFALAVPEPSRIAMLLAGLGLLGGIARRRSVGG